MKPSNRIATIKEGWTPKTSDNSVTESFARPDAPQAIVGSPPSLMALLTRNRARKASAARIARQQLEMDFLACYPIPIGPAAGPPPVRVAGAAPVSLGAKKQRSGRARGALQKCLGRHIDW